ncbi:UNVERIFIED_CONTAM: hypothetical protein FKN15_009595 [Acipenser sinensis]
MQIRVGLCHLQSHKEQIHRQWAHPFSSQRLKELHQSPATKGEPHQPPVTEGEPQQSPVIERDYLLLSPPPPGGDYTLLPPSPPGGDYLLLSVCMLDGSIVLHEASSG